MEETIVNATAILDKMSVWKTQDGRSWKNPDHAMLWTRWDCALKIRLGFTLWSVGLLRACHARPPFVFEFVNTVVFLF